MRYGNPATQWCVAVVLNSTCEPIATCGIANLSLRKKGEPDMPKNPTVKAIESAIYNLSDCYRKMAQELCATGDVDGVAYLINESNAARRKLQNLQNRFQHYHENGH